MKIIVLFFLAIIQFSWASDRIEAKLLIEKADNLYQASKYQEAEQIWDEILAHRDKTDQDMRRAAAIYFQNGHYLKASEIYEDIIERSEDTISDAKNFLSNIYRIMRKNKNTKTANNFEENYIKKIRYACEKICLCEYSNPYELLIIKRILRQI